MSLHTMHAQATGLTCGVNDAKHCRSGRLTGKIDFHFKLRGVYIFLIFPPKVVFLILLKPMGVLAPGSADARPSAQPPMNMSGIYLVQMSAYIPENYDPKF